jgi:hypothetical protein
VNPQSNPHRIVALAKSIRSIRQSGRRDFYSPKNHEMIPQLCESTFGGDDVLLKSSELSAASRIGPANFYEEKYSRPSRLRNAGSKSFGFGFCICDRRMHNSPNLREPAFIGFSVALRRPKVEEAEARHCFLPQNIVTAMSTDRVKGARNRRAAVVGAMDRRHREPADKTCPVPHFEFDYVSASKVGRLLDGVPIAGTIELESAQYLAVPSEEIDLVPGQAFH